MATRINNVYITPVGTKNTSVFETMPLLTEEIELDFNAFSASMNAVAGKLNEILTCKSLNGIKLDKEELAKYAGIAIAIHNYAGQVTDLRIRPETIEGFSKIIARHPYMITDPQSLYFQEVESQEIVPVTITLERKIGTRDESFRKNKAEITAKIDSEMGIITEKLEKGNYSKENCFAFSAYRLAYALFKIEHPEEKRLSKLETQVASSYGTFIIPQIKIR